ncbi:MAG: ATP-binding protein [Caldilineaceae bacterium]
MVAKQSERFGLRVYSILLAGIILFANLSFLLFLQDVRWKALLFQLPYPLWNLLAALALSYAAIASVRYSRRLALAWGLLAVGRFLLFSGETTVVILALRLGAAPFPSLADGFFLVFYPFFLCGILLLPVQHLNRLAWLKTGLDISIVLLASGLVIGHYWLAPLAAAVSDQRMMVQALALAYPVGNLVLLWMLLMLLYRLSAGEARTPLLFLAVGLALQILIAGLYGRQSLLDTFASDDWLSFGWLLTNLIFGFAGIWQATGKQPAQIATPAAVGDGAPTQLNTWVTYLPYGAAIIAFVMLEQTHNFAAYEEANWLSWSVGLIIGLVLIRQMMTLHENRSLLAQVQKNGVTLSQTNQALRETQTMLVHAEKMNALGQMVAGVAHELNNPIAFVNSNLHALKQMVTSLMTSYTDLEQLALAGAPATPTAVATLRQQADLDFLDEELDDLIDTSLNGLARVRKIVENLRTFSRLDEAEYKLADLREGIESTLLIAQPALKKRIRVELALGALPLLYCRPAELNQVFLNLILNAAQAIADQGAITITGQDTESEVILTFHDTGCGMSAEVMQQIFNPFFTTKPAGVGTGLGLTIAYKIITAGHGGTIDVASEPGHGTTFTIRLPKEQPT